MILFHLLFWIEKMGVNTVFFTLFIFGVLFYNDKESFKPKTALITVCSTIILSLFIVINNSLLAKTVYWFSLLVSVGFIQDSSLKFIGYAFMAKLGDILSTPRKLLGKLTNSLSKDRHWARGLFFVKITAIPSVLFVSFYTLYALASPKFAELSDQYWSWIGDWLWGGPSVLSFPWLCFMTVGMFLIGGLLFPPTRYFFKEKQAQKTDELARIRKGAKGRIFNIIGLKREFQMGLITMVSLNALLLLVNAIDINQVWLDLEPQTPQALSVFVHEGTWVLIFSILLAIGVTLFFFRGNLNFLMQNRALKLATYAWIIQNIFLALSVGRRNFHYIEFYGLAYKRIAVVIFILLVVAGLVTLFVKVRERKTIYFLFHRNAWILYTVLLLVSAVNWDGLISRYNLTANTRGPLDRTFLYYDISDKNLPLLMEYEREYLQKTGRPYFKKGIEGKQRRFASEQEDLTWLSWNYPDYKVHRYLERNKE